jgi:hypothetical protein
MRRKHRYIKCYTIDDLLDNEWDEHTHPTLVTPDLFVDIARRLVARPTEYLTRPAGM